MRPTPTRRTTASVRRGQLFVFALLFSIGAGAALIRLRSSTHLANGFTNGPGGPPNSQSGSSKAQTDGKSSPGDPSANSAQGNGTDPAGNEADLPRFAQFPQIDSPDLLERALHAAVNAEDLAERIAAVQALAAYLKGGGLDETEVTRISETLRQVAQFDDSWKARMCALEPLPYQFSDRAFETFLNLGYQDSSRIVRLMWLRHLSEMADPERGYMVWLRLAAAQNPDSHGVNLEQIRDGRLLQAVTPLEYLIAREDDAENVQVAKKLLAALKSK